MLVGQINSTSCRPLRRRASLVDAVMKFMGTSKGHLCADRGEDTIEENVNIQDKMIPSYLSKELKSREVVAAKAFDKATILYAEVNISSPSKKEQSVYKLDLVSKEVDAFINRVIQDYDVCKVATVAPSYMLVSGLDSTNTNRHAEEIALVAIDLLKRIKTFQSKHISDVCPQLKIGIHTGPCVAAIIGMKIQKLCLFGDSIRKVIEMETSSCFQKIHISLETKTELEKVENIVIDEEDTIKEATANQTFWLTDKDV